MKSYKTDWVARRDMIAHAEVSQYRTLKDPIAHTNKMVKRYGPEYKDAYGAAYGLRAPDRCSAVVRDLIDEELSARYGWTTIAELSRQSFEAFKARYPGKPEQ